MHFLQSLNSSPMVVEEEWCTYVSTYAHAGVACMHSKVEVCTPTCMGFCGCAVPCLQDTSCKPTANNGATFPCPDVCQFDFEGPPAKGEPLPCHRRGKGVRVSRQQL